MLATVLHLHRGTPYIYQGEELGMTNAPFVSIDGFRDIQALNHYAEAIGTGADPETVLAALRVLSRDNARTPMQWDDTENAGFTTGTPWMAVNPNHKEINAQAEIADNDSVFHHYRRLIELRHTEPTVAHGDFHMLLADHDQVYAFTRRYGTTELLVLANFFGEPATVEVPDAARWQDTELILANYPVDAAGSVASGKSIASEEGNTLARTPSSSFQSRALESPR
jgi:oligo-1,6-glucosidase